jgi:hypothetical protein
MHAALTASAEVISALGGGRVFDDVPRGGPYPYVTFGPITARDWSTGSEGGQEHAIALHVWSQAAGRREVQRIAEAIRAALDGQSLSLTDHRLINLRHELSETRREADGETYRGILRFRAVTEPAV